ncbi:HNH endonuclease [Aeromonas dhakensis]|uniref:HNH endonuclease n=1 Tax=Aeromonas dhakensis TaxID=196024 RepID=UPI002B48497D|nr:HNH endonuclease [Aeromonas dhakensis]
MNTNHTTKPITLNGVKTSYTITTDGTITNTATGRILKHALCGNYYKVSICHNKQTHSLYVHRLLALHFLEVPEGNNIVVDHINNNRLDNSLSNLQFISQSQNILKATRASEYKRVPESIRQELLSKYHEQKQTAKSLSNEYGIPLATIYTICNRKKK